MRKLECITMFLIMLGLVMGFIGCDQPTTNCHHTFSTEWSYDETFHWKKSTCGCDVQNEKVNHIWGDYISNNDATTEADGTKTRICTVCGYADTETEEGTKIDISLTACEVGDIILINGTKIPVKNIESYTIDENNKPVGIVAFVDEIDGMRVPKMIGLRSDRAVWAPISSNGYNLYFRQIEGDLSNGDVDGSDNWDVICSVDSNAKINPELSYPVFYFANTYGQVAELTGTEYEDGWYVPSIKELYDVYKNKIIIQKSLDKVGSYNLEDAFWSSSQSHSQNYAYKWDFSSNLEVKGIYKKNTIGKVLVLQTINVQ